MVSWRPPGGPPDRVLRRTSFELSRSPHARVRGYTLISYQPVKALGCDWNLHVNPTGLRPLFTSSPVE